MTVLTRPAVRGRAALSPRYAYLLLAVSATAFGVLRATTKHRVLGDLHIYQAEGMAIRNGAHLYAHLAGQHLLATYPPFAGVVFVAVTPVPIEVLQVLSLIANFGLLVLVCALSCRLVGVTGRAAVVPVCVFAAIGLWCEPVFTTFAYGQINLALLALILWDFTLPEGSRWRGVGTGLAAGIKVTPGILIVYLLLTRRFRAAATASLTFAGTVVVSVVADPRDTWRYWTNYLFDLKRLGDVQDSVNQTLRGVIIRIDHETTLNVPLLALIAIALLVGLWVARRAYQRLGDAWGLPVAAVTGLLISPISWTHHWVWALPIAVLFWYRARRWLIPTGLIFLSWVVWLVPVMSTPQLHLHPLQIALSGFYVLFGLGFIALAARRSRLAVTSSTNPA